MRLIGYAAVSEAGASATHLGYGGGGTRITRLEAVEKKAVEMNDAVGVSVQRPIGSAEGTPSFSLRVFTIAPGGHTPYHAHAWEHLNYVIDGEGALVNESGRERVIRKGDFALVMPGEKHSYRNTAREGNLILMCGVPREHE